MTELEKRSQTFKTIVGGKELNVKTGVLAQQANGSVLIQYGETAVLVTAVMGNLRDNIDYFPLSVDYEERLYADGLIKGSRFIKREGRPSDEAILSGRLIDRTIRPLFSGNLRNEVQIIATVVSFDQENDANIIALVGASIALSISDMPWDGPIAGVRVGKIKDKYIINPTYKERNESILDMVVSGTADKINMIETKALEAKEDEIVEGVEQAQKEISKLIDFINKITKEAGKEKAAFDFQEDEDLKSKVLEFSNQKIQEILYSNENRLAKMNQLDSFKKELKNFLALNYESDKINQGLRFFEEEVDSTVHTNILEKNLRPDRRKMDELRPLWTDAGVLPRVHGSGLFNRGETQALSVLTLADLTFSQTLDGIEYSGPKRFMHHYNFSPFCSGETGPLRGPGRREIGHGALAEKALEAILPSEDDFPYAIRIVTEILSSNGSTSMASVCGSTLALMDGGVPIKKPAAGIAMGLMSNEKGDYKILTDIQGPEDHYGDMDLKVAGTRDGVTAMQMDVKINGITSQILKETLSQSKEARLKILSVIEKEIKEPRANLSKWAPRVLKININPEKIGLVVGSGGRTINDIIAKTGANINIENDGRVFITGKEDKSVNNAKEIIENIVRDFKKDDIVIGRVVKIADFGFFIALSPEKDGLLHVSEMNPRRQLKMGDKIQVAVLRVERDGKIALTEKIPSEKNLK